MGALVLAAAKEVVERFHAVPDAHDGIADARLAECQDGELGIVVVVLHQKNRLCSHRSASRVKKNVAPRSTSARAHTRPPWRVTTRCTVASPTPVPSNSVCVCSRWKAPNSLSA